MAASFDSSAPFARMYRVKRQALLLFFGGGGLLTLLGMLWPAGNAQHLVLGRLMGGAALVLAVCGGLLACFRPHTLKDERYDWLYIVIGTLCVLMGSLEEITLFATRSSSMVLLWPVVYAASFLDHVRLRVQIGLVLLTLLVLAFAREYYVSHSPLWLINLLTMFIGLTVTALAVSFFRDASVRDALELERMVATDPLTGLSNRRKLHKQFGDRLATTMPGDLIVVVLFDLDHFKLINDRFGHQYGDQVLQHFAQILRGHARASDLVARLGGEEFMWITTAQETCELVYRTERLREALHRIGAPQHITVSAGAAYLLHSPDLDPGVLPDLMELADQALYQAKEQGRDRLCLEELGAAGPADGTDLEALLSGPEQVLAGSRDKS